MHRGINPSAAPIWVIGQGAWGKALTEHLRYKGLAVEACGRATLSHLAPDLCMHKVLIAVPSAAFLPVLQDYQPYWGPETEICWATKGLVDGQWIHHLIQSRLVRGQHYRAYGLISGPSFAAELLNQQYTAMVLASEDRDFSAFWQQSLQADFCHIALSADLLGVSLGGVLKNILAVILGMAVGCGYGYNAQSFLLTQGMAEMCAMARALGAQEQTLWGLAGLGDLILTATGPLSRNRRFGVLLGEGYSVPAALREIIAVVESVEQVPIVLQWAQKSGLALSLVEAVAAVLEGRLAPKAALQVVFQAGLKDPSAHIPSGAL